MSNTDAVTPAASGDRMEWLFLPQAGSASKVKFALGMLGCAALGAGVYGALLAPRASAASWPLLLGGVALLFAMPLVGPKEPPPLRVGELGILLGDPEEQQRLHWYEIGSVRIVEDDLRLERRGDDGALNVPLAAHARAAARIIAEASQRIGDRVDVSPKAHDRLPRLSDADGARVPAARLQLAGRKCLASGVSITFESDARLCENCAALYHQRHVPAACVLCQRPLAGASPAAQAAG